MLHSRTTLTLSFLTALALASGHAALAQESFYTTGTYTIDAAHPAVFADVGFDSKFHTTDGMGNPYNPTVNVVTGGSVSTYMQIANSSIVNISGGFVNNILTSDTPQLNISGGLIPNNIILQDGTQFTMTGGTIGGYLDTDNKSIANFYGGTLDNILASDNSVVAFYGGSVTNGTAISGNTHVTIYGGTFDPRDGHNFGLYGGSLTLVGNNLMAASLGADPQGGTDYALSGTLQNGTNLAGYILLDSANTARFTLQPAAVPEPGSIAILLGLGAAGAGLVRKRRSRS